MRNLESAGTASGKRYGRCGDSGCRRLHIPECFQRVLARPGVRRDTVPLELNAREISERNNRGSEMIVYGRSPMMISAQCLKKNLDRCTRSHAAPVLRDRKGAQFPVACCCNSCYNIIYNSVPTNLLADGESVKRTGCRSFRLSFTTEDGAGDVTGGRAVCRGSSVRRRDAGERTESAGHQGTLQERAWNKG